MNEETKKQISNLLKVTQQLRVFKYKVSNPKDFALNSEATVSRLA